ncbi:hypothetical protein Purlil1_9814 [Purpureocillium lilacinum]|uniref:Uncharacterized protein n=1 Tax=Purpureocillium lilacinum TaxID=33203 RepID=A0ABR0BPR3_PURLI|nr:hypothetical protein Purlil1_9814 [Purpureocillium lilacinum]
MDGWMDGWIMVRLVPEMRPPDDPGAGAAVPAVEDRDWGASWMVDGRWRARSVLSRGPSQPEANPAGRRLRRHDGDRMNVS